MSTIQTTNIKSAASASNNIVLDASGNAAFAGNVTASGNVTSTGMVVPSSSFLRNRIINGDMRIDQRNGGSSVTPTGAVYTLDRWFLNTNLSSRVSIQRSSIAPAGFTNSLLVTSLSAYTPVTTDGCAIEQYVEGFNWSDLGWGTASAQTATLSFWVRSSLTGTFSIRFEGGGGRNYVATYTINTPNTYEYKTVTIPGDTSGTWNTTNGLGVGVWFDLGSGPSFNGSPGAWTSSTIVKTAGSTNLISTNGATFYLTGVQLEVGTVATPFERRQYGQELSLCQRYAYSWGPGSQWAAATSTGLYFDANILLMIPFGANLSAMRTLGMVMTTVGTQGTDWAVQSGGAASQTGFSVTCNEGVIAASKTSHGLTSAQLRVLTSSGRIIISAEI